MIKDLIKYVIDLFPTTSEHEGYACKGPCEPVEVEPTVEDTIKSRKEALMARVKQDVEKVTQDVVRNAVRVELFKKYGMDEDKEVHEYRMQNRGCNFNNNNFMDRRLVEAIVNEMTNDVMGNIRRREARDEIQGKN